MTRALASDEHGTLRLIGGVLFGVGALVLLVRRTSFADPWGDGAIFATLAIPAALLYGGGLIGACANFRPTAWQSAFTVFGLVLIPLALIAFLSWVGGDADSSWNTAWIFGLTALFAFVASLAGRVRYTSLLGSLALILAWASLWDEILSDGLGAHTTTLRWLMVAIGVILLLLAASVAMRRSDDSASDIVTGAGISFLIAGGITGFLAASVATTPVPAGVSGFGFLAELGYGSSIFWDIELLVASLTLLAYGSAAAVRGPVYVGAVGLVTFIAQVGLDLDDKSPSGHALGWPLVLLLAGGIALAISIAPALRRASS